ncbi:MAG: hypothetical protein KC713_09060, partial [Candidatus Omnitrophica bacterium]|nr:hypothetical protein [Candidatus Omnitrophota bacterium]
GDIPLIGSAFRHKDATESERELIIFITPHILREDFAKEYKEAFIKQPIIREQNIPQDRLNHINSALSNFKSSGN